MKRFTLLLLLVILGFQSQAVIDVKPDWAKEFKGQSEMDVFSSEMSTMDMEEFLALSPKKYRKKTGKRLGLKKSIQLKIAQRMIKKQQKRLKKQSMRASDSGISSGLYIVLAIFGLAWIAMGVMDDWSGNNWIINLLLTFLLWLPGLIHALIKKKDYF